MAKMSAWLGAGFVALLSWWGWPSVQAQTPTDSPNPTETPNAETTASPTPSASEPPSPAPTSQPTAPSAKPAPSLKPEEVSETQIKQLVTAMLEVEPLIRKASRDLQAAKTDDEYQKILQKAESDATQIVEKNGLTVDQYKQFILLANDNPAMRQRVEQVLNTLKPSAPAAEVSPGSDPNPVAPAPEATPAATPELPSADPSPSATP